MAQKKSTQTLPVLSIDENGNFRIDVDAGNLPISDIKVNQDIETRGHAFVTVSMLVKTKHEK